MRAERCANSEALDKYEREVAKVELLEEEFNESALNSFESFLVKFDLLREHYNIQISFDAWYKNNV